MSLFKFIKKDEEEGEVEPTPRRRTKRVIHHARYVQPPVEPLEPAEESDNPDLMPENEVEDPAQEAPAAEEPSGYNLGAARFQRIMESGRKPGGRRLPDKYRMRTAMWDLSSVISLVVNAVLLAIVLLLAFRIHTLENTINGLLGGLYDNFVRMDNSYITTTIQVEDMPIPLDFTLPVVQEQTNVTLTQDVTIRNAYVVIDTGMLDINAPATVTLPAGTILPVALRMDVPVQTTVLVDLEVPVNIELASASSSDPAIANLHTAFLGLQDTIGPLYCLLDPAALDYRARPLCDSEGLYIQRAPPTP
jgi:hypothetical protein